MSETQAGYKWEKTKALCAYFADRATGYLGISKSESDTGEAACWKPFEQVFGYKNLKVCKADWRKTGTLPNGNETVNELF